MDNSTNQPTGQEHLEEVLVARQPVFDAKMRLWGYELLYRHAGRTGEAAVEDDAKATSSVIADGVTLGRSGLGPEEKTLVNFPMELLLEGFGFALPPESCVIEILESVEATPEVLKELGRLKHAGYTLALDDYVGGAEHDPFLELADIIKVDMLAVPPGGVEEVAAKAGNGRRVLLAEKVEDQRMHQLALDLGFSLFQGFFFQKPELVHGRKISSSLLAKLKLLKELADEDYDTAKVARIIETDLSLSYRLLRYINSAAFGRREPIEAIRQAIMVLGQRNLAKWMQAVLMSDLNPTPKGRELVFMSVKRAKFLELLGQALNAPPARPGSLFMLGLFSLLDALLGQPMEEVLQGLPLSEELTKALLGGQGEVRQLLDLAMDLEHADWKAARDVMEGLQLSARTASELNAGALRFAGELTRDACPLPPAA